LVIATSASAAFPGKNGRLALTATNLALGSTSIVTVNSSTGAPIDELTGCNSECHSNSPDWSPKGRRLAFVSERTSLVTTRADGSDRTLLYRKGPRELADAAWSPSGRRIAFTLWHYSNAVGSRVSDIYTIRRNATHLMRLTYTGRASETDLDWSSENRLVFRRHQELFTMRPDGRQLRRLTRNAVSDGEPDWAPGGKRIVFVRGTDQIWTMGLWGKNAEMITQGRGPAWAPDGSRIAYAGGDNVIHTIKPSGQDDAPISDYGGDPPPFDEGPIAALDWRSR
jgi:Tol biopolymer transport system component